MKKYLPFILPLAALFLVGFFGLRWYRQRTQEQLTVPDVTAGTEIENLSNSEQNTLNDLQNGTGNYKTVNMEGDNGTGEIRYEIKDGKALFSISANLPTGEGQIYYLYIKENGANDFVQSQVLQLTKGGLITSSAVTIDKLPIEIEIRLAGTTVLRGQIQSEN